MVMLPYLLQGIAIPALASLLSSASSSSKDTSATGKAPSAVSTTGKETSSTGNTSSAVNGSFANMLKAECSAATKTESGANSTEKVKEQAKTSAIATENTIKSITDKSKDSLTTSTAGSITPAAMISNVNGTATTKVDSTQLDIANTVKPLTTTEPVNQMKSGTDSTTVIVTAPQQGQSIDSSVLDKYRMNSLTAKNKGLSNNNLTSGLKTSTA
jgi:hypothetical protein